MNDVCEKQIAENMKHKKNQLGRLEILSFLPRPSFGFLEIAICVPVEMFFGSIGPN